MGQDASHVFFGNLIIEVKSNYYGYSLLIRSKALCPAPIQGEESPRAWFLGG